MSRRVSVDAAVLPRLDAFDEEFGPEHATILPEPPRGMGLRFWAWIVVMLAAGIVGALALTWPSSDAGSRLEGQPAPTAPRTASRGGGDEQVDRLLREVAALKRQVRDLTSAQQQAAEAIAAAKAAEQDRVSYWYSNLAALRFGIASQQSPEPGVVERPATVRARPNDVRRRENGAPLSLDPPQ